MEVQTRDSFGKISIFSTLKEAKDFAEEQNKKAKEDFEKGIPLEQINVVYKISFSLPTGERVRLVSKGGEDWVLRQMEDELGTVV